MANGEYSTTVSIEGHPPASEKEGWFMQQIILDSAAAVDL
jgi:hypothetical protein